MPYRNRISRITQGWLAAGGLLALGACSSHSAAPLALAGSNANSPTVAQPAPLDSALPAPLQLVDSPPAPRQSSDAPLIFHTAADCDAPALPPQNIATAGSGLIFQPAWTPQSPDPAGLAWALYRFNAAGYAHDHSVRLNLTQRGAAADCLLALADFGLNRWQFYPVPEDGVLPLDDAQFASATNPATSDFFALIVFTGTAPWELRDIRIGAPQPAVTVYSISPLTAWPGEHTFIEASTDNDYLADAVWTWDFGGATTTAEMYGHFGFITLGTAGVYMCSLTVNHGIDQTQYAFTLTVKDLVAPHIIAVQPYSSGGGPGSWYQGYDQLVETVNDAGPATSWSWDFGGGATPNTSTQEFPGISWGTPGTYTASVTASNAAGSDTYDFDLVVEPPPAPDLTYVTPGNVIELTETQLQALNYGGPATSWSWDFGGGCTPNTSSDALPQVTPDAPGTYNCHVTATNQTGSSGLDFVLEVSPLLPPHITTVTPTVTTAGLNASFWHGEDGGASTSWLWDFGGGCNPNASTDYSTTVQALDPGIYHCSVTATNPKGSDTYLFDLTVQ